MHIKIISIANQKGGVGKTTTAINLSAALAIAKKNVLLIDLDPQGNATTGLGVKQEGQGSYNLLIEEDVLLQDILKDTLIDGLKIISSSIDLAGAEVELVNLRNKEFLLKSKLEKSDLSNLDYIIFDCAPSLGLLSINALVASHSVIAPVQCEFFAMEGLVRLMRTISMIQSYANEALYMEGILLTMSDRRNNLSRAIEEEIRENFGELVYKTVIPRNIKLSEAPSHGQPALLYDTNCLGSVSYVMLAKEILDFSDN
ncbi:Chromosome partitioning protein ParA [Candidatus Cyrtobacter comes]|uniref:Chromosome partitioning protein ParA n=1 Tax=Candidatus Cyrtobacter comes TaxID=675776 RepID=A0ABU5L870_9RICK|nr:ParA family protein [Candidatus Cyrtobacter comes]MDZ5762323.1 Chromosome partitioning protein ParA [Candidatus Cyrtobacter comes]